MKSFSADTSELLGLEGDLRAASAGAVREVRQVVAKGSLNIKTRARDIIQGHPHVPTYPYTITYDTEVKANVIEGEIGPDKQKQVGGGPFQTPGNLGAILEYGSVNNAPLPHLAPALEEEVPRFEKALEDLGAKLVER